MEWFFLWFIAAIVVGVGAGARGRNEFGWWLLAMLISPLLAVILLALMPSLRGSASASRASTNWIASGSIKIHDTRPCPFCAEDIRVEAVKCKHCGSVVEPAGSAALSGASARPDYVPTYDVARASGRFVHRVGPKVIGAWIAALAVGGYMVYWLVAFASKNL